MAPETNAYGDLASRVVVVVPAYQPGDALPRLVRQLVVAPVVAAVVVVNDGSASACGETFEEVGRIDGVFVARHVVNLGKGAALKTGLNYAACQFPTCGGIVTADADGQHVVDDILRIASALIENRRFLILGVRTFGPKVPLRSRFGNTVTRQVMRFLIGEDLIDTQTGLRGIPLDFVPELMRSKTTGYDFELDMLITCRHSARKILQIPISTIYIDGNRSSHFNPLLDSMRIYYVFLRYCASSVVTAMTDYVVFVLLLSHDHSLASAQIFGRAAGILVNFTLARKLVFHANIAWRWQFAKFITLVSVMGVVSYSMIQFMHSQYGLNEVVAKMIAEGLLFLGNFALQRQFIFARRETTDDAIREVS
jgi:putative flippase GtrA